METTIKKVFINCSYNEEHAYRLASMIFLLRRLNIEVVLPDLDIKNEDLLTEDIFHLLQTCDASIHDFDLSVEDTQARFLVPMVYGFAKSLYLTRSVKNEPLLISTTSKDLYYDLLKDIKTEEKNYFKNETFIPRLYDLLLTHGLCGLYNADDLYKDTVEFGKVFLEIESQFRENKQKLPLDHDLVVRMADRFIKNNNLN